MVVVERWAFAERLVRNLYGNIRINVYAHTISIRKKETFLKAKVKVNFKIKPKSPLAKTYKYSKTPRHNY